MEGGLGSRALAPRPLGCWCPCLLRPQPISDGCVSPLLHLRHPPSLFTPAGCRPPSAAPSAANLSRPASAAFPLPPPPVRCRLLCRPLRRESQEPPPRGPPAHLQLHPSSPPHAIFLSDPTRQVQVKAPQGSTWQGMVGARHSRRFRGGEGGTEASFSLRSPHRSQISGEHGAAVHAPQHRGQQHHLRLLPHLLDHGE